MKRKLFQIVCLAVVCIIIFGMIAGCGQQSTDPQNTGTQKQEQKTEPTTKQSPPVELTVEIFERGVQGQDPADNNYWTKWIQENFGTPSNITLKFVPVPRGEETQQLNIMMASNTSPDISFTYNWSIITNYIKNGGLAELGSDLDKYGPNLKKFLGEDVLFYGQYDGKQYSLPAKNASPTPAYMTFIRKDWLDKVGLPVPKTTDEYYNVLKAFKQKDPGGVGSGVIPLGASNNRISPDMILSFRKDVSKEDFAAMFENFDSVINGGFGMSGLKDGYRYLNKLYSEGLISPDYALDKDGKNLEADIVNGKVGSFMLNQFVIFQAGNLYETLKKNVPNAELVSFKPFTDNQGKQSMSKGMPFGIHVIVPKSSQRVAEVMKYLDWMSKPEVLSFLQNGKEGVHYAMENGFPKAKSDVESGMKMYVANNIDFTPIVNGVIYESIEKALEARSFTMAKGFEKVFYDSVILSLEDSYTAPYFKDSVDSLTKYSATITAKAEEIRVKAIMAAPADFDKVFDTLVKEYLDNGGTEVIQEKLALQKK